MIKYLYNKYILNTVGFIIFCFLIWNKILRGRLPKKLPLILTDATFILLLSSCILLTLSLIKILNSFIRSKKISHYVFINDISNYMEQSLQTINKKIKLYIVNIFKLDLRKLYLYFINKSYKYKTKNVYIYIIFFIPKIILPLILLNDIFLFNELKYFYISSITLILPMIYNYTYYNLHQFYCQQLETIEKIFSIRTVNLSDNNELFYEVNYLSSHFYIQEHTLNRLNIRKTTVIFDVKLNISYINTNLKNKTLAQLDKFYDLYSKNVFPAVSKIYAVIYFYTLNKKNIDPYINIYQTILYMISWFYLLFTANYEALSPVFLQIICNFNDNLEPFSQILLK